MVDRSGSDDLLRVGLFWPTSRTVFPTAYVCEQNPEALDLAAQQRLAVETEAAGFDFGVLADAYGTVSEESSRIGHHDPSIHAVLWAMALFSVTSRMGLISTMHPTFIDAIDLAQYGAQLDYVSNGRWGWNVTTGYRPDEPRLFGADGIADHDERYGIAEEAVVTVRRLWAEDRPQVEQRGTYVRLSGRLPGPGPATPGGPAMVNAGASDQGLRLAGRYCDYLFAPVVDHAHLERLDQRMREEAANAGRDSSAKVLAGVRCLLRDDPQEARDEWEVVKASMDASKELNVFAKTIAQGSKGAAYATNSGRGALQAERKEGALNPLVGTPETVAEELIELYHDHGYRGILVNTPYWTAGEMPRYGRMFARLQEAGVWQPISQRSSLW
ncbi:LLM class flavin-dependent oxidoreductase [Dactylosporangium fulvum]|uniref:LLM class flavin-dependent oxidoreductase n=1 Tax=Dactylosporangium fulvum TaxID=53359 RepID=A0ABY5VU72_9ACTN|nr:LLM class flavin-dependent oxidoreductase [Dactylosporangium fulvum]UWP80386.1 LLM class flavin-dependent oxidoreductase [Dactylosporangium fulvum]